MTNADKMFEELGYIVENNENITRYSRPNCVFVFDKVFEQIVFNNIKSVYKVLTIEELKAINEKCKELEWLDD